MHEIRNNEVFRICNYRSNTWYLQETLHSRDELIEYISRHWKRSDNGTLTNTLYDRISMNWNKPDLFATWDIWTKSPIYYYRDKLILDQNGAIIDPKRFECETKKAYYKRQNTVSRIRILPGTRIMEKYHVQYRRDPVPGTGNNPRNSMRDWKTWHHNLTQDSIPEYREYIRKKAVPVDKWTVDPFTQRHKSWKEYGKYRHQWEKHLPKHIATISLKLEAAQETLSQPCDFESN